MEYKIHIKIRNYFNVHIYVRFLVGVLIFIIGAIVFVIPLPFSAIGGGFLLLVSVLLVIPANKIRHLIKVRKGVLYMMKHIHRKQILKHKMRDISSHIKEILNADEMKKRGFFHKNQLQKKEINKKNTSL